MREIADIAVSELMSKSVVAVTPETSIEELARLMEEHDYNGFPVVNEARVLQGLVTRLDLFRLHLLPYRHFIQTSRPAHTRGAMTSRVRDPTPRAGRRSSPTFFAVPTASGRSWARCSFTSRSTLSGLFSRGVVRQSRSHATRRRVARVGTKRPMCPHAWAPADGSTVRSQPATMRVRSNTPVATSATPARRPTTSPRGTTFSTRTATAMAVTQRRFMTPATNRSAMSAQQHPRQ
jgi:CBS domain